MANPIDHHAGLPADVKIQGSSGTSAPAANAANDEPATTRGLPLAEGSIPSSSRTCVESAS